MNVLQYHSNNTASALLELFPNIGLNKTTLAKRMYKQPNLMSICLHYTTDAMSNQKQLKLRDLCENFAKEHNFDPLVATNWGSISRAEIKKVLFSTPLSHLFNNITYNNCIICRV